MTLEQLLAQHEQLAAADKALCERANNDLAFGSFHLEDRIAFLQVRGENMARFLNMVVLYLKSTKEPT